MFYINILTLTVSTSKISKSNREPIGKDMANSNMCLWFLMFLAVGSFSPHSCKHEPPKVPLFIFGDSIFDTGNNNYIKTNPIAQANYWPFGQNFFKFPTGRWSDGRVIPDFIAEYANLPLILPYLYPGNKDYTDGLNFASGGAGALDEINQAIEVISLNTQLSYFNRVERILRKKLGETEAKKLLSRAVYFITIGTNDYRTFASDSKLFQSYSLKEYVSLVIGNLTGVIKGINEKGGRKFAVMNLWPLNHLPAVEEAILSSGRGARGEELIQLTKLHNKQLYKTLKELKRKLKGFVYSYADSYTVYNEIASNPEKYGIKEVKKACCGSGTFRGIQSCGGKGGIEEYQLCENPNEYFFFDSNHGTDKGYQILAEMMWNGNSNSSSKQLNVKSLFHL